MVKELETLREKFVSLKQDMPQIVKKSFDDISTFVEDKMLDQLDKGLKGDGTFQPNYSPVSIEVYGKPDTPIKLYDTGDFYKGVKSKAGVDSIEIDSSDSKKNMLIRDYGEQTLNLTEANKEIIANEYLQPSMFENIKEYLK